MQAMSYSHSSSSTGECTCPPITKGKRTKRPRSTPIAMSSNSEVDDVISSTTTEEDEDMARCLILLAQGSSNHVTSGIEKDGVYVYECKTCNRCFNSFQALGGHRASHKKPRILMATTTIPTTTIDQGDLNDSLDFCMIKNTSTSTNTNTNNNKKLRVHECSICGAEFSSGQALGGHMRRHRQIILSEKANVGQEVIKKEEEKPVFALDLNLPAPSEENPTAVGLLFGDQRSMVFSSPLVDCHY